MIDQMEVMKEDIHRNWQNQEHIHTARRDDRTTIVDEIRSSQQAFANSIDDSLVRMLSDNAIAAGSLVNNNLSAIQDDEATEEQPQAPNAGSSNQPPTRTRADPPLDPGDDDNDEEDEEYGEDDSEGSDDETGEGCTGDDYDTDQ